MVKICRICGNEKEIMEFHKKKGSKDGHRNECKECVKDIQNKYKENPSFKQRRSQYDKERYSKDKEKILKRKKEYYFENRETILKKKKQYRKKQKL